MNIREFEKNLDLYVKECIQDKDGFCVYVEDRTTGYGRWVDAWISNNQLNTDWNQYIFDLRNEQDKQHAEIQNDFDIFEMFSNEVEFYLFDNNLVGQKEQGNESIHFIVNPVK